MSPRLPKKKDVVIALLERSSVFVHLDPRSDAALVPKWFKRQPQLVLQVGLNLAVPIPDLEVTDDGILCTLSFSRAPFHCYLPWSSIYALVAENGRGMVWPDDIPPEVAAQGGAAPQGNAKSQGNAKAAASRIGSAERSLSIADEAEATETGATETGATETGATETGATETGATETGATETGKRAGSAQAVPPAVASYRASVLGRNAGSARSADESADLKGASSSGGLNSKGGAADKRRAAERSTHDRSSGYPSGGPERRRESDRPSILRALAGGGEGAAEQTSAAAGESASSAFGSPSGKPGSDGPRKLPSYLRVVK